MNVTVFNLISGVNETRFLIRCESCKCNLGWMKVYVIQSKNWCECKELDEEVLVKMIICETLAGVIVNVIKHVKLMSI